MQSIKNMLHKDKSHDDTSATHQNEYTGQSGTAAGHNTANNEIGSTTGDSTHTGLTGSTPTNASATRSTGLTGASHSDDAETGTGRSTAGTSHLDHTTGHDHSIASKFDPTGENVTHDHKHLQHVTHRSVAHQEVEEVERQREVDRHVHHVQHHVQPVLDKQIQPEVIHQNTVPVTKIHEKHSSTNEDRQLLSGLASQHKDTEVHRPKERTVVDLGEKVHENVHHHVHHVTQPVIEQEVVDRHRIHTVIPVHHTTHEAPIIHKSSVHEPVTMDAFKQGGGQLGSGITHDKAGVLNDGDCERSVDGVGEKLASDLHLGKSSYGHSGTTGTTGTTGTSGLTGATTGDRLGSSEVDNNKSDLGGQYSGKEHKTSVEQNLGLPHHHNPADERKDQL